MISNEVIMERNIENESFDCIGTIRVNTENKYIITILRIAEKFGQLTPENLRNNLLPNQPITMAENIIKNYQALGFIGDTGNLTSLGEMAIKGDVYMPEQGEYTICATSDSLVNNAIIKIYRIKRNENKEKTIQKPEILKGVEWRPILVLLGGQKEKVIVESIDNKVQKSKSKENFSIEVRSNYTRSNVILKEGGKSQFEFQNNRLKIDDVWSAVTKNNGLKWTGDALQYGFALLPYGKTNANERSSFSMNLPEMTLNLNEFGNLKAKRITVKIQPSSQKDADIWAQDVILDRIVDFISEDKFMHISEEVKKKFETYTPRIPERDEMVKALYSKSVDSGKALPKGYWYLQAPVDLSMEEE